MPSWMRSRDTVEMKGFELVAILVAPCDFQNFLWGAPRAPLDLPGRGKIPCTLLRSTARPRNRSTAFLQGIMAPWALPPCKNAINLPVARGPANMQSIGLAALDGSPSGDLEALKKFFKEASQLRSFFGGSFGPHSRWPRDPVKMQGYELATLGFSKLLRKRPWEARGCFLRFVEVATGPCKNAGIRAGGYVGGRL